LNFTPRGLSKVVLLLDHPTDDSYDDLSQTLGGKYGSPFARTTDPGTTYHEQTEWHSADARIVLHVVGINRQDEHKVVSIIYTPLMDVSSKGL